MFDQTKKSSHVHNICKFMSLKNDSVVRTMSMLEYDFCFHAEYNPQIVRYESQPHGFEYYFNGRYCRYTPDFQVFYLVTLNYSMAIQGFVQSLTFKNMSFSLFKLIEA